MCGIAAVLGSAAAVASPACVQLQRDMEAAIARRGPDHFGSIERSKNGAAVVLSAAVLHLRGATMATQPVLDASGSVLLWNGEVFGGLSIPACSSDTAVVAQVLFDATRADTDPALVAAHVIEALASVEGPFALCFFHEATETLVYGRDRLGRRSLLEHMPSSPDDVAVIASIAHPTMVCKEIPCTGLFYYNDGMASPGLAPWPPSVPAVAPPQTLPAALDALAFDDALSLSMQRAAKGLLSVLYSAVAIRLESVPSCNHNEPSVGILFSGGLDSVVLAALAHHALPPHEPLELYNVCFDTAHASPDRKAAVVSWNELRRLFPTRDFRLVEMDIDGQSVTAAQPDVVACMQPCVTHMDFNIGTAFWFLARGVGCLAVTPHDMSPHSAPRPPYASNVKVLLVGIGADEQLAGYGRHKAAFERDGYDGLRAELRMDMDRLWLRNLGRDDRMISDHGREARFPYLDEHVVNFLAATPLDDVVDFSQPRGVGDKLLLRVVARGLGLRHCTGLPKQAIQFGTRMAKHSNATARAPRLVQGATPFLPAKRSSAG
ncbi:hypothetical protein SDRG_00257 [Saprolegnia diclina VS20]|uniref:Glutamine amidotransferase type-2 domain-containing protein n=1 Tax=Saprolegnia diclina (strain VS20) TaxID=1156394 RepID=T0QWD4_SAPDV|nr:hypothetical protein SDRG_00257 [Saprolegnia diclina VS20]EQC42524.1 hypothetical protein SDRG_00257 [Saprolegnia diclina VS20]|eukprot:XP_008603947.1 hypothetical protein SDRG_00257 [Saprolegnia diclina VS20]